MQKFDSSVASSSSTSLLELFRNLYIHTNDSNNNNNNNNGYDIEDDADGTARISPSLPENSNPYLVLQPKSFTSPMKPSERNLLPNLQQPLPGLPNDQHNLSIHYQNVQYDSRVYGVDPNSDRKYSMLKSLGLIGMMTYKEGLAEFPKLLSRLNENYLRLVGIKITSDATLFLQLATHRVGSSAIRTLLRCSAYVDDLILFAVQENFIVLMTSKYGQYIVIPTLRAVAREKRTLLYELAESHVLRLACHEIGCVSLNEMVKEVKGGHRDHILSLIAKNAVWLAHNQYGNFVVQNVISLENPFFNERIGRVLYGSYVELSFQREGSYVVEKCLKSMWAMEYVMKELMESGELVKLANSEFGNYVVQCALRVARGRNIGIYEMLVNKLRPHLWDLQRGYRRNTVKVIEMLEKHQQQEEGNDHNLL